MTTLDRAFEDKLHEAVLDEVESEAVDIGRDLRDIARAKWISYAAANGYDIDHIWQDVEGPLVERDSDSVTIRVEWPGLTALFEWGVSPHTIDGNPLLVFIWEDAPPEAREEFPGDPPRLFQQSVNWGSQTGGIPEARAIRDTIDEVGRDL